MRKRPLSLRVANEDLAAIKEIAQRLRATESDVVRFAIRIMLPMVSPLRTKTSRGRDLLPVFLELGEELSRFFSLDEKRLDELINAGATPDSRVEPWDIRFLSRMHGKRSEAMLRFLGNQLLESREAFLTDSSDERIREYFYEKYASPTRDSTQLEADSDNIVPALLPGLPARKRLTNGKSDKE